MRSHMSGWNCTHIDIFNEMADPQGILPYKADCEVYLWVCPRIIKVLRGFDYTKEKEKNYGFI